MQRLTLSVLLLNEGRLVSIDAMSAALWGESIPPAGPGVVRTYIHRLRRVLHADGEGSPIRTQHGAYSIEVDAESVDVSRFQAELRRAKVARRGADLHGAASHFRCALDQWADAPLAGVRGVYAEGQRARLEQLRVAALEGMFSVSLELGQHAEVTDDLRSSVLAEPLHERLRELLMLAYYRSGRQAEALFVYEDVRQLLRTGLGADPGPALRVLHQRILEADETLLRPAGAEGGARAKTALVPRQLPVDLAGFVGRQDTLARLLELADEVDGTGSGIPAIAIGGMAGVGKTALAVHLAHQLSDRFPDGQLYVDLRGFDPDGVALEPSHALSRFLEAFSIAPQHQPADQAARAALLRSLLSGLRVLILLDNARDSEQVLPLLPGGPGSLVIVTSRHELAGLAAVAGAHTVALDCMSHSEATEFLVRRIGMDRVAAEPEAAGEIIELCSRLPLALAIAATRAAARPTFGLAALAGELRAAHGTLDAFSGSDRVANIRTVFGQSTAALSSGAARLFRLLAVHPGATFCASAAAALVGTRAAPVVLLLNELVAAHLITECSPGRYGWFDLLRAYAREDLQEKVSRHEQLAASRRLRELDEGTTGCDSCSAVPQSLRGARAPLLAG